MHPEGIVNEIKFSVLSEKDILNESVLEITSTKLTGIGSIQDARLGPAIPELNEKCPTCYEESVNCRGHFGHIMLNYPVLHPLFEKEILKILKLFCYTCFRFLRITMKGEYTLFDKITKWTDKKYMCPHCGAHQPIWSITDKFIFVQMQFPDKKIKCTPYDIKVLLSNFSKDDLEKIGVLCWPENMIITAFPIIPPCARPSIYTEDKVSDDHLTIRYIEIIKANTKIDPKQHPSKQLMEIATLIWRISVMFSNTGGKGKYSTTGKAIQGYRQKLCGKNGLARENMMGKRVDQSGRTVIGPEPTLRIDQVAVPEHMAQLLTVVETACAYNLPALERIHARGQVNYVNGQPPTNEPLKIGDVVTRQLLDNDRVIINRQPTLHKGSMIGFKAVISKSKTICFNLSVTKSFNADFDGDEMNIHPARHYTERAELDELCSIENNLLSERNGSANVVLVQDHILSLYLMSHENTTISRAHFNDILLVLMDERGREIELSAILARVREIEARVTPLSGRAVISLCFPHNFFYKEDEVEFENGIMIEGKFTKKLGATLIAHLFHVYGSKIVCTIINNLQFVADKWLKLRGFTVGLEDCFLISKKSKEEVVSNVLECFVKAEAIEQGSRNRRIREVRIQEALNNARNIGMKIAKNGFRDTNNFKHTITSGSKGDFFNIAQISGILGQQYLNGRRVDQQLNNGTRTLPHYLFNTDNLKHKYEARGFVRHSFLRGLDPREMYAHAVVGRAGVVATAMGTSESGYMQRKIVKLMEDVHVANDGTVRDETNQIYQFYYGNGLDVCHSPNVSVIDSIISKLS